MDKMKQGIGLIAGILAGLAIPCVSSVHTMVDSLRLDISVDSARKASLNWIGRFKPSEIVSDDVVLNEDSSTFRKMIFKNKPLLAGFEFQLHPISPDSTAIIIKASNELPKPHFERFLANSMVGAKQAFGIETDGIHPYSHKSAAGYLGLSLLNVGLGMAYSDYHSFVGDFPPFVPIANGAGEIASIAFMFSDENVIKGIGIGLYSFYKVMGLVGLANINLHNQITASGYKFHFQ